MDTDDDGGHEGTATAIIRARRMEEKRRWERKMMEE